MKKISQKPLLLAILTILIVMLLAPAAFATTFSDMPDDWSTPALENAVNNGLLGGIDGKLMPDSNLTRAQMAAVINRAFGATEKANISNYTDVATDAWYYADMARAVEMKTFEGSANKLYPGDNITREEAFVVLARAFKLSGGNASVLDKFSDKAQICSWAKDGIASLVAAGYAEGANGKLNPDANITRAEFAQIMNNLLSKYIKTAGTYSENITGNLMVNKAGVILKDMTITGDLVIGDGVGDGDVTLDGVVITGRMVIRGGGENSIKILGNSNVQNIIIARVDGIVRVYAADGTEIGEVIVDGKEDVIIEGTVGNVTVDAEDVTVNLVNATVTSATVNGVNSNIVVGSGTTVENVTVNAADVDITVEEGATVDDVVVNGADTAISGDGNVGSVEANANNVSVDTVGTEVTAGAGTTGVTAGDTEVDPGTSETVDVDNNPSPTPGGGSKDSIIIEIGDQNLNIQYSSSAQLLTVLDDFFDAASDTKLSTAIIDQLNDNFTNIQDLQMNDTKLYSDEGWDKITSILTNGTGIDPDELAALAPDFDYSDTEIGIDYEYIQDFIDNYKLLYDNETVNKTNLKANWDSMAKDLTLNGEDEVTITLTAKNAGANDDVDTDDNINTSSELKTIGDYLIDNFFAVNNLSVNDFFTDYCVAGDDSDYEFTLEIDYGSTTKTIHIYKQDN